MNLTVYLRHVLSRKFILLIKKEQCEICGDKDNLEVHHEIQFIELLNDTLELLDLTYKDDINNYSINELKKIKLMLLGKHLDNKYITLCQNCHDDEHVLKSLFKTMKQLEKIRFYGRDIKLINRKFKELNNKKLFESDKELLVKFLSESIYNNIKIRYHTLKIKTINEFLQQHKIKYKIESKKENGRNNNEYRKRYWIISNK